MKMIQIGTLITVIFSLFRLGSNQLSHIYPIIPQNVNPAVSYLTIISSNLRDVSTNNNHPLVQTFTSQFLNEFQNNPAWSIVFNIANIPGTEAGSALQEMLLPILQRRGCPKADIIAKHCFEGSAATMDAINSNQYQIAFGRAHAKYLLNHGYLKRENVLKHAKALAEDIGKATESVNPVDKFGYLQVLINAAESFVNRLGVKFIDFSEEAIDMVFKEFECIKKGICV